MVATRRLIGDTRGIGFWAAVSYFDKKKLKYPPQSKLGAGQLINDAMERYKDDASSFHIGDTPEVQVRRHPGGGDNRENGASRPHGGNRKRSFGDKRKRTAPGLEMPAMSRGVPAMGGRPSAYPQGSSQAGPNKSFQPRGNNGNSAVRPGRNGSQDQRGASQSRRPYNPPAPGVKMAAFWPKKPGYAYRTRVAGD